MCCARGINRRRTRGLSRTGAVARALRPSRRHLEDADARDLPSRFPFVEQLELEEARFVGRVLQGLEALNHARPEEVVGRDSIVVVPSRKFLRVGDRRAVSEWVSRGRASPGRRRSHDAGREIRVGEVQRQRARDLGRRPRLRSASHFVHARRPPRPTIRSRPTPGTPRRTPPTHSDFTFFVWPLTLATT